MAQANEVRLAAREGAAGAPDLIAGRRKLNLPAP